MEKFVKSTGRDPYLVDPNDYNPGFFGHLNALVEAITLLQQGGGGGGGGLSSILVSKGALTIPATGITITGNGATLSQVGNVAFLNIPATSGPQGSPGATGPQGSPGLTGPAGPTGSVGAVGPQGIQGPIGLTGAAGAVGPQGNAGPAGLNGNKYKTTSTTSITPSITSTTFIVADADLSYSSGQFVVISDGTRTMAGTVTNYTLGPPTLIVNVTSFSGSGSGNNWQINLQGIQGPTGVTGATGPAGPTGPQGVQGIQGATGAQGIQGLAGAVGATGPQGITGSTGAQGNAGARWFYTVVDPNAAGDPATSVVGDFVLQSNGQTWRKTALPSTWVTTANILGPQGIQGNPGTAGSANTVVSFVVDGYGGPIVALAPGVTVFVLKIPFIGTYTGLNIQSDQAPGAGQSITLDVTGFATGTVTPLAISGVATTAASTPTTTVTAATTLTFKVTNTATSNVTRLFVNLTGSRS